MYIYMYYVICMYYYIVICDIYLHVCVTIMFNLHDDCHVWHHSTSSGDPELCGYSQWPYFCTAPSALL